MTTMIRTRLKRAALPLVLELTLTTAIAAWGITAFGQANNTPLAIGRTLKLALFASVSLRVATALFIRSGRIPRSAEQVFGNALRTAGTLLAAFLIGYTVLVHLDPDMLPTDDVSYVQR